MKKLILVFASLIFLQMISSAQEGGYPRRIISLSPSVTEILYELGLGDRVVGVTDYCNFPDDVKNKTSIGGYLNTNYEAIILLKPDLVIVPVYYGEALRDMFDKAGIPHMAVNTFTVQAIFDSIEKIGRENGVEKKARQVILRLNAEIEQLKQKVKEKTARKVMIVVGRDEGSFDNMFIAGKNTFYSELLNILGCENVYGKTDISYPSISAEGVLRLNPDVIIELLPDYPEDKKPEIIEEWKVLQSVNAVKNNKVYVFSEDYICIPGPRFTLVLQKLEKVL